MAVFRLSWGQRGPFWCRLVSTFGITAVIYIICALACLQRRRAPILKRNTAAINFHFGIVLNAALSIGIRVHGVVADWQGSFLDYVDGLFLGNVNDDNESIMEFSNLAKVLACYGNIPQNSRFLLIDWFWFWDLSGCLFVRNECPLLAWSVKMANPLWQGFFCQLWIIYLWDPKPKDWTTRRWKLLLGLDILAWMDIMWCDRKNSRFMSQLGWKVNFSRCMRAWCVSVGRKITF